MSKTTVNVPLVHVTIRRDANTITPITVPPYELTMLRQMFGKENVTEGDDAGVIEVDSTTEYERLSAKYGAAKVSKVYGDDEGERLIELVEKHAVKAKAPAKTDAEKEADKAAKDAAKNGGGK
jgi:hypothetical protein